MAALLHRARGWVCQAIATVFANVPSLFIIVFVLERGAFGILLAFRTLGLAPFRF